LPVSAVDCVQPALQHTRQQLFSPFRWGQWSRLALVGILAAELHLGGCGFGNLGSHWPHVPHKDGSTVIPSSASPFGVPPFNSAHMSEHIAQFLGLIIVGLFAIFVLGFIFLYISSIFRFILFDSILQRHCSIRESWNRWRRAGGRFFLWQIVFQIAVSLFLAVLVGIPLALALAAGWAHDFQQHVGRMIGGVVLLLGLFVVFIVTAIVVQVLARDFLVPIMALEDLDFADGWHRVLAILRREKGDFAVYLLLKLVLSIAAGIIFSILAVIPALLIAIPAVIAFFAARAAGLGWSVTTISLVIIVGTCLLFLLLYLIALVCVPATVFFPAYALYFLAGRYPALDGILHPAPPPPPLPPPLPDTPPSVEPPPLPPSPQPIG
jgi:hypothetical protein